MAWRFLLRRLLLAIPTLLGVAMIVLVPLRLVPDRGRWTERVIDLLTDLLRHILLPAVALALPLAAVIARVLKAALPEALTQDHARQAQAFGYSRLRVILVEALRNAPVPTVTLTAVQVTFLIGGTVPIERILAWPGIGDMAIGAVIDRDLPLIQGLIRTFAPLYIAIDIVHVWLDPRLRHG